jgi:hypothetical protein
MEWGQFIAPAVAAASGLGGLFLGSRLSQRGAHEAWSRDQQVSTYAAVLNAIDRQFAAFGLLCAQLDLAQFDFNNVRRVELKNQMDEWGRWDKALDEVLPAAELVASDHVQRCLSYRVRLGIRTQQRLLLMTLDHSGHVEEAKWRSAATLTLGELEEVRRILRADLSASPSRRAAIGDHIRRYNRRRRARATA